MKWSKCMCKMNKLVDNILITETENVPSRFMNEHKRSSIKGNVKELFVFSYHIFLLRLIYEMIIIKIYL